jgi:hypothetical protein
VPIAVVVHLLRQLYSAGEGKVGQPTSTAVATADVEDGIRVAQQLREKRPQRLIPLEPVEAARVPA